MKDTAPKISIIVPVYNMERYLRQCVDSIIAQTFTDWELILVNDGSKDASAAICDEYASSDARIRVIHKENSGQADSRNIALKAARADLIGFVDSDDWIEPDMYEVLYRTMVENDADISVCGYFMDYANRSIPSCKGGKVTVHDRDEALRLILDDRKIKSYLVDKLYKKKVVSDLLPVSYYYEDYATIFKWFVHAGRVSVCECPEYHYRQRQGSTDHDNDPRKKYHFFLAECERYRYLTENAIFPERRREFAVKVVKTGLRQLKGILQSEGLNQNNVEYVRMISLEIQQMPSLKYQELGLKHYIRLRLLECGPECYAIYARALGRLTGLFRFRRKKLAS